MDIEKIGPKMRNLSHMQREFVLAIMAQGDRNATAAAKTAGYSDASRSSLKTQAHRLWHDPDVQEAIHEEATKRIKGMLPSALATLGEIMENPQESGATRIKAATTVMDRAGIHAVSESKVTTEVQLSVDPDRIKRIISLAQGLGLPVEQLLGARLKLPPPVEAEFEEMSSEGLEGLI